MATISNLGSKLGYRYSPLEFQGCHTFCVQAWSARTLRLLVSVSLSVSLSLSSLFLSPSLSLSLSLSLSFFLSLSLSSSTGQTLAALLQCCLVRAALKLSWHLFNAKAGPSSTREVLHPDSPGTSSVPRPDSPDTPAMHFDSPSLVKCCHRISQQCRSIT